MKKLTAIIATALLVAFAAPAFSATNPFMDVPMNHWAYDAIGQLAAHGILSGYPDGTYKGKQPTTRYEMASALARALAVVDMTKASKQDVEMLKRLVVEFRDELEALGVKVDELDSRVKVLEDRLGGWHIHGSLVLDVINRSANNAADLDGDGEVKFDEARLFFERTWGENDEYFFRARLRNDDTAYARFDRFYVEMPFFGDTRLTVGRWNWDLGTAYRLSLPATGSWTGDSVLTDRTWTGMGLTKNFGIGKIYAYFAHPDNWPFRNREVIIGDDNSLVASASFKSNWEVFLAGEFQFTEQFGFDLGVQAMFGDNAEDTDQNGNPFVGYKTVNGVNIWNPATSAHSFKNIWTAYAGLRFNANENIAFKGIYYHQKADSQVFGPNSDGSYYGWWDYGYGIEDGNDFDDDANHWALMVDVKQEALKFTSLWLEYGQYKAGFWAPQGMSTMFPSESKVLETFLMNGSQMAYDMKYYRIALGQQWTDKIATHLFYYGYTVEDSVIVYDANTNLARLEDAKAKEFGLGVQYQLNPYTSMGLNYIHVDNDLDGDDTEDNVVRFRTAISF